MRHRFKADHCLNCHHPLRPEDNYCPQCGQENTHYRLTVADIFREVIDSYLNYDSRLVRSIIPFLFKPGALTVSFIQGQRRKYVHPIRFYIIISFIYFLLMSFNTNFNELPGVDNKSPVQIDGDSLKVKPDLSELSTQDSIDIKNAEALLRDSLGLNVDIYENAKAGQKGLNFRKDIDTPDTFSVVGVRYLWPSDLKFEQLIKSDSITPDALLDSLHASEKNTFNRKLALQAIKLGKARKEQILQEIVQNIPTTMFAILPVFAFILFIIYWRNKIYYVEHLVFTFHLHAFVFFILLIGEIFKLFDVAVIGWFALVYPIYITKMFKYVYKQSWFKTIFKIFLLLIAYSIILSFGLVIDIFLSLFLF